jgi:hypothetical protein
MKHIDYFITKKKIPHDQKLKYLITIPCVNREERNAINVIDKTFEYFESSGMFDSDISIDIVLFESGSKDLSYLSFIKKYSKCQEYLCEDGFSGIKSEEIDNDSKYNVNIKIIYSKTVLNGVSNTLRMFIYLANLPENLYDFVMWMDDDIYVCKNFIKNADIWIKNYANFSLFSSLYVPYNSFPIKNRMYVRLANLPGFYGTCCTVLKPKLAKYVIPLWYDSHFEQFDYNPDTRFRDSLRKYFPNAHRICVSFPSLVQHMNIGSAIKGKTVVKKGHFTNNFIGVDNDPQMYINDV